MDPHPHDDEPRRPEWTALREAMEEHQAPAGVEQALLLAYARARKPQPWYRRWRHGLAPLWSGACWPALAGIAVCAFALVLLLPALQGQAGLRAGPQQAAAAPDMQWGSEFIALASAERIHNDPNPHLVGASLPRSVLAQMGLPVALDAVDDEVRADMLVGADGAPLALRLALN